MNFNLNFSDDSDCPLKQETRNDQKTAVELSINNQNPQSGSDNGESSNKEFSSYKRDPFFTILSTNSSENIMRFDRNFRCMDIKPPQENKNNNVIQKNPEQNNNKLTVSKENMSCLKNSLVKAFQTGEVLVFDFSFELIKDLRIITVTLLPECTDDGSVKSVLAITKNISENKVVEETLQKKEERFRYLAENSPDTIIVYDLINWKLVYINRSDFFGYSYEDLDSPESIRELIHPDDLAYFNEHWRCILCDCLEETFDIEFRVKKKDDFYGWVQCREVVLNRNENGSPSQILINITDITEHKQIEKERLAHLHFFESMDRINRAIQGNANLEQMMHDVLDVVLSIFKCDRAFLMYPCDPEASSWQVPMERTKPEYPGVRKMGLAMPMDHEVAATLRLLLRSKSPIRFGRGNEYALPKEISERFGFKSFMSMAIHPNVGKPWQFGIHQCSSPRIWTPDEERLLQEIGRRLSDGLTGLLAYRDLKENEERLRLTLDAAQIVTWEINLVNGEHYEAGPVNKLFGRKEEYKHSSIENLAEDIHPEDREWVMSEINKALHGESDYRVEYRTQPEDGSIRWIAANGNLQYNHEGQPTRLLGIASDITKQKLNAEALRENENKYRTLFNLMEEGVAINELMFDENGNVNDFIILDVNPAFTKHSSDIPETIIGRHASDFYHWNSEYIRDWWKHCSTFDVTTYTEIFQESIDRWFLFTATKPEGNRFFTIFIDITERKKAEEEIYRFNQELEQRVIERTSQLDMVNKELEAFSYSVSHDLRAPLRHINGYAGFLKESTSKLHDAQIEQYISYISDAANRMNTLIDDLLSFSKLARNEISKTQIDIKCLVEEVIHDLVPETKDRNIDWNILEIPTVTGDRAMLKVVIANLIANAVKYTSTRPQAKIEIGSLPNTQNETSIFIRDNGVGFNMDYADRLFGVFQRLHRQDEFEGTGIGLAIVRRVIARHGGRTWAEGKIDQGATFYFSLPQP